MKTRHGKKILKASERRRERGRSRKTKDKEWEESRNRSTGVRDKEKTERSEHQHSEWALPSVWSLDTHSQVADRATGSAKPHGMLGRAG